MIRISGILKVLLQEEVLRVRMSSWGGRKNSRGFSSYSYQNANRLRDKLESRNQTNNEENDEKKYQNRPPPGLKGREIGLWYAQQQSKRSKEQRMLSGPSVSLAMDQIKKIRGIIANATGIVTEATSFRSEFQQHITKDFMEILKSSRNFQTEERVSACVTDEQLLEEFIAKAESENYVEMLRCRQKLPAYLHKDEIIDLIEKHQVILVEGNTGCGKTTQVSQYILDDALINKKGSRVKVLCTQPRRIAATSIAERVASERSEQLGLSVGYQIRLEKVLPRDRGSITFCTTGVLLKLMELDPALTSSNISHIIIDEIHERNVQVDVCLALIKQIVKNRKDLKIILMSATLNAERFSQYFDNCPRVHIQGFTHNVEELYLEDILEETKYDNFKTNTMKKEPVWVQYKNKKQRGEKDGQFDLLVGNYARSLQDRYSKTTVRNLMNPETEKIDVYFIEHLIQYISYNKEPGAILVIVPGYSVISKLHEKLQNSTAFPPEKFVIYALHSMLTGNDQRQIFLRPPDSIRKIILSTPLSETSITIEDVVYVINSGKMRKPYFDFERNANVLEDQWITKANETQRKGRAGRVREGICYHLYTRGRSNSFDPFEQPEILRIRLEEILLTLKALCIKDLKWFMSTLIDIPNDDVIMKSVNLLQRLGAFTDSEELTPLGLHLARLSAPPQIGKILLFSSIFSCVDPISSVSAGLSFKSPFYSVMGKEELCDKAKRQFSIDSDQLAVVNALSQWREQGNRQRSFCYQNFLSHANLVMLDKMKNQFCQSLYQSKFLISLNCESSRNNQHSRNENLLRAIICGGLYPNIAYRSLKISRHKRREILKTVERSVKLLPSSVNCDTQNVYDPGYIVFHELNKFNSSFFISETTANVSPYAIIMFGDRVQASTTDGTHYLSIGDIVIFKCNQETAQLLFEIRGAFNRLLEKKIEEPSPIDWNSQEGNLLKVIIDLISSRDKNSFEDSDEDDEAD